MNTSASEIKVVTSAFIIIGNEILSGRTRDVNLSYLATELVKIGIRLDEVRVVRDDQSVIANTVKALRAEYDYVFTSGGIGPTHDDITCESIALSFGLDVHHHPEALARMKAHAEKRGVELNEARMRMARTPLGASLITNSISAAPGFTIENVHVMAGVPSVFQAMVAELLPTLRTGTKIYSRTVVANLGEGTVAKGLGKIQNKYPSIDIGSYPFFKEGVYGTSLVLRGTELNDLEVASKDIFNLIIEYGGSPSYGDES